MRKLMLAVVTVAGLFAAVFPTLAIAYDHVNCNAVPRAEWGRCVFDQAADQSSQ